MKSKYNMSYEDFKRRIETRTEEEVFEEWDDYIIWDACESAKNYWLKVDVIVLVEEPGKQALRARASLKNGFLLHVNEVPGKGFRSYSYHLHISQLLIIAHGPFAPESPSRDYPQESPHAMPILVYHLSGSPGR